MALSRLLTTGMADRIALVQVDAVQQHRQLPLAVLRRGSPREERDVSRNSASAHGASDQERGG